MNVFRCQDNWFQASNLILEFFLSLLFLLYNLFYI